MDLYTRLKSFLGLTPIEDHKLKNSNDSGSSKDISRENNNEPSWDRLADDYERLGFNVFSNPVEMHRYFEQQMNQVLKSFGVLNDEAQFGNQSDLFFGGTGDPFFGQNPFNEDFNQLPGVEDYGKQKDEGSLREKYLKSGYESAVPSEQKKLDKDIDGKFDMRDFDSVLQHKAPQSPQVMPKTRFFGKTIISKTIRNPDGTYETQKTIKDHTGNEQTTITRSQGDKQYTITKKTDREGNQEVIEDMVNMDEHDKDKVMKDPNWFPFDKLFK